MKTQILRAVYDITGVVQGVGFRPAVYRSARLHGITGNVSNRSGKVRLVIEGSGAELERFMAEFPRALPPHARVANILLRETGPIGPAERASDFSIAQSDKNSAVRVVIPPDLRVCPECAMEIMDPANRRYGYPFTTCTDCGPRYTVVESMPYDRTRTTMADFPLCGSCSKEYNEAGDRRFHAETIACPHCGPSLSLLDNQGAPIPGRPLSTTRQHLHNGSVAAIRGIGGFLLTADAFNRETLQRLRSVKRRPHKPFAVMAPDVDTLRRYCLVTPEAERLLSSPAAPIVILDVIPALLESRNLPIDLIAPDTMTIGAMLPTSPLHMLLFDPVGDDPLPRFDLLIMTSGNQRGEPICIDNDEALRRLHGIADIFLLHDRRITLRNDDSVCVIRQGAPQLWRRARGYAPGAIGLHRSLNRCVLAMGAELKNTVAVAYERSVVLSPHIGDLETPEALQGMERVVAALPLFLDRRPDIVAVDLHPDMHSTRFGHRVAGASDLPVVEVQHHFAHAVAGMAEHGLDHAISLCFDGTGLGPDGTLWGAELLEVTLESYQRHATFVPVPLPGGDAAVRHPVRQLIARLLAADFEITDAILEELDVEGEALRVWAMQCSQRINTPLVHSAGRLFDAFSALLGLPPGLVTYEAQAAIRLESAAKRFQGSSIPVLPFSGIEKEGKLFVDWSAAFTSVDIQQLRREPERWAMAFHHAVARAAGSMVDYYLSSSQETDVVLTGGVFMNELLTHLVVAEVENRGLTPRIHRQTPPNDGCIALGQAVIAGIPAT